MRRRYNKKIILIIKIKKANLVGLEKIELKNIERENQPIKIESCIFNWNIFNWKFLRPYIIHIYYSTIKLISLLNQLLIIIIFSIKSKSSYLILQIFDFLFLLILYC